MMDVKISLPLLPLRDIVVFPSMVIPLFVGRDKSISALNEVMKKDKKNNNNYINLILLKQIGKAFIYKTQVEKTYLPILKEEIRNG